MTTEMNEATVLKGNRMQLADYAFQRFGVTAPSGTTLEEVQHPAYFRNYAHQLKPGAIILILSDDFALDAELRVLTVTKTTVTTRVLRNLDTSGAPSDAGELSVSFGGRHHMWRIMRGKELVEKGFASEEEAAAVAKEMV